MSISSSSGVVELYDGSCKNKRQEGQVLPANMNEAAVAGVLGGFGQDRAYSTLTTEQSAWTSAVLRGGQRAAEDMELAKEVQARLFPRKLPPLKTLSYAGVCIPAGEVGGDYFDFLDLGRGFLGLAVGDVAGKGIAAALLMASLQANLRSQCALALDDIGSLLRSVNRIFHENTREASYATLFFAEYSDADQRLHYVNCGHPAPLLLRADDRIERLESTATVLGLTEDWDCAIADAHLAPGDTLVFYTDGVTEAVNKDGEEFGEHRLIELLHTSSRVPAPALLQSMVNGVRQFAGKEFQDDITLVAASCSGQ